MCSHRFWIALVIVALLVVGCAQPQSKVSEQEGASSAGEIVSFTVRITADGFIPSTIRVHKGDRVQLVFVTEDPHDGEHPIRLTGYGLVGQLSLETPKRTIELNADKVGTFSFFCINDRCTIHHVLLEGRLIIQ